MITDIITRRLALIVFRRALIDKLYGNGRFNYLTYFSQDDRFHKLFRNYRFLPIDDPFLWYTKSELANKPFVPRRERHLGTRWTANSYNCYNCFD